MNFLQSSKIRLLFVFALVAIMATGAFAQTSTTGSIGGNVKDPSGAAVAGATVTATGPNLIRPQSATTGSDGNYQILNLPPGNYSISVDAGKGFAKYEQTGIVVNLGRMASGEVKLQVAGSATEVTVSEQAAQIGRAHV